MVFLAETKADIPTKDLLSWTFDDLSHDWDKPVYVDVGNPSRTISPQQAKTIIRQIVAGLYANGFQKGDCVCVHSFNDIYYSMLFLGIIAGGGIFAGTNPSYTPYELNHHMKTSQCKFLITEPEMLTAIRAAAKQCSIPESRIFIFNVHDQPVPAGFKSWTTLLSHGEQDWIRFDDEHTAKTTTAARLFSSGTTGLPKAAVITHYNLTAEHTLTQERVQKPYEVRRMICVPEFHAAAVPMAHTTALRAGHVNYVMRRFDLEALLASLARFDITELPVVSAIAVAIIMSPLTRKYSLSSIRVVNAGAAPLAKETQKRLKDLLDPRATVTQLWGMTETSCIACMLQYPEDDDTGSVGRMLPGIDTKLVDDDGRDISAPDVRGELCVRGPIVIPGYFDNEAANAASWDEDGFLHTGDVAYVSGESGKWYIVDRKKELIKVRGFQVAPPELEAVLLSHPGVVDAAVIGINGRDEGEAERPRAFVVRQPKAKEASEEELKRYCGERLARFKELTGGVKFVNEIPKSASGKILKRILREWAETEEGGAKS